MAVKTIINTQFKIEQWYSKDLGMIQSKTFNNKGKFKGSTVLSDIK